MRNFLKVEEKWKNYEDLEMEWIHHHNPDLVIFDDAGGIKERIDLNGFTDAKLTALLDEKGFRRR